MCLIKGSYPKHIKNLIKLSQKTKLSDLKMSRRSEQIIFQRGHTDGQQVRENSRSASLTIRHARQSHREVPFPPAGRAAVENLRHRRCWQDVGKREPCALQWERNCCSHCEQSAGSSESCGWNYQVAQQFHSCVFYPQKTKTLTGRDTCTPRSLTHYVKQQQKQPQCLSLGERVQNWYTRTRTHMHTRVRVRQPQRGRKACRL